MVATVGVILAGGRARRMGGEKPFVPFRGRPLIAHAVERARPQVDELLINASDATRYATFRCEVIADAAGGFQGPLAGVVAGLDWMAAHAGEARWLATFACDAPFFPTDMVARLIAAAEAGETAIAIAASGAQHHPVFAVWRADLRVAADAAFTEKGVRKMDDAIALFSSVRVPFAMDGVDPFFNINSPEDLARAEQMT